MKTFIQKLKKTPTHVEPEIQEQKEEIRATCLKN